MGGGIDALQLGAVAALDGLEGRIAGLDVGQGELVGGALQVSTEALDAVVALVKTRAQHTAQTQVAIGNVKVFVELGEGLGIELTVAHVAQAVVAVLGSIKRIGRGEEFLLIFVAALVILHAARDIQPRGDAPVERNSCLVALLVVDEALTLGLPVGVLHRDVVVVWPVLHGEVSARVIALIIAQLGKVVTSGKQIDRHQRIVVLALADHVLLLDGGEHIAQIERHAVVKEVGGVAQAHVVAVVVIAVDDALCVCGSERQIGLVLVGTSAQTHRVGDVSTRLEEIGGLVTARRFQFLAPTEVAARFAGTILVLETWQDKRLGELETAVIGHIHSTRATALCGDEDDTVSGIGTIERGCRRPRQGTDALDVVGVDVAGGITRLTRAGKNALGLLATEVLHGNTIHDVQHVVISVDGLGATHYHAATAARTRCTGVDGHTSHLAAEGIDEVGVLHPH